jgi:RHS repeat-associated protein
VTQESWGSGVSSGTHTYGYDTTNQLTAADGTTFAYDANGNRNYGSYTVGTSNRTTNDGTYTYTYDGEGNLTQKSKGAGLETWYYTYDQRNLLTSVRETTNGTTNEFAATYTYDALGRRVQQDRWDGTNTVTTEYAFDATGQVWAELNGSNAAQYRYLNGDGATQVLARINVGGGTVAWVAQDRLGSVRDVSDTTQVNDHVEYDAFGKTASESNSANGVSWGYTGLFQDRYTFLAFADNRVLDPTLGKWLQQDPIMFQAGDANLQRYTGNNATNATDPSGLFVFANGKGSADAWASYLWKEYSIFAEPLPVGGPGDKYLMYVYGQADKIAAMPDDAADGLIKKHLNSTSEHLGLFGTPDAGGAAAARLSGLQDSRTTRYVLTRPAKYLVDQTWHADDYFRDNFGVPPFRFKMNGSLGEDLGYIFLGVGEYTYEGNTYAKGCFGLVNLRIGGDVYGPKDEFFTDIKDATKRAGELGKGAFIAAIQYNGERDYVRAGTLGYESRIESPPVHAEGNHAVWHQVTPTIGYWEFLVPDGWLTKIKVDTADEWYAEARKRSVNHKPNLPRFDNTIYVVGKARGIYQPPTSLPLNPN